jgi:Arabinose efflux permease
MVMIQSSEQPQTFVPTATTLAALLACGIFVTIGLFSPGLVLPQMAMAFSSTPSALLLSELTGTIAGFSFALSAPFCGALVGRRGCRQVILPGLVLFAVFGVLPAALDNLWLIVIARFLLGIATAAVFTAALAGIGTMAPHIRAKMFGWFSVVGGVAAIILFPIVGQLGHFGWRPAFLVHLTSLAVLPLALAIPASLGRRPRAVDTMQADQGVPRWNRAMLGILLISALAGMGMILSPMYGPIYLASLGLTDTRFVAIPLMIGAAAAVLGSAAYGVANRIFGIRGIFIAAGSLMGTALIVAGLTRNIIVFSAAIAGMSAMVALLSPNLNAAAVHYNRPERAAQAIGLTNGMMFGAQLLFPFLAAAARAHLGISGVFLAFGVVIVAAALLMTTMRPPTPTG